jgi:hypothetical protein
VKLHGAGFIVTDERAKTLGLGRVKGLDKHIRPYCNGRDLTQIPRNVLVIDLDGLEIDVVRERYPEVYQHVFNTVKPERDQNNEKYRREFWWLFGRKNTELRASLRGLRHFIATPETAKHRFFVWLSGDILPDNMLINIGLEDSYFLGVLSSRHHVTWALAAGGTLEDRPRYNKTVCFEPFPFPDAIESQKSRIRELGEQLDAHRKRQQSAHPKLTMTGMYNVLEKLRAGEALTKKEQEIHEQGLVSVLREIHDELDAAVADAYGWPADLSDEDILARLVALNHERAEEERRGIIRWLRPEFQNPMGKKQTAIEVVGQDVPETRHPHPGPLPKGEGVGRVKQTWPKTLSEQAGAVLDSLASFSSGATAKDIARSFGRATDGRVERVAEILETLEALGKARELDGGRYVAV